MIYANETKPMLVSCLEAQKNLWMKPNKHFIKHLE